MLVSVIIPTFNRASTIIRAVDSVLAQSYQDFELIIVDDGSTDNTKELLAQYIQENKVIYLYQENGGVSKARNYAVSKAKGQWISFLDSDDAWLENKLELQVRYIESHPETKLIHGEEIWIRNGKRVNPKKKHQKSGGQIFKRSLELCLISPSAVMLRRDLFLEMDGFREDFEVCEDFDLWLKITSLYEVAFIEEPIIMKFGGHEDQLSRKFFAMDYWRIKSLFWILENRELDRDLQCDVIDVILRKGRVLITGYRKHQNLKDLPEVESIVESASNFNFK